MTRHIGTLVLCGGIVVITGCSPDKASTPVTPSSPSAPGTPAATEPMARLAVTIDNGSRIAISTLSRVRFDASASAGSGQVQYLVDYGDGVSSSDVISEHSYLAPGSYVASATVIDAAGHRASASQPVTVRAVEGAWFSAVFNRVRGHVEVRRLAITSQTGLAVRGDYEEAGHPGRPAAIVTGVLEGNRTIRLNVPGEPEIVGTIPSVVFGDSVTLDLTGFGATAGALPFQPIVAAPIGASPTARLDVQVDSFRSKAAILGYSPVRFSASGSQGDSLVTFIEFGDGAFTTDSVAIHPCIRQGLYTSRVTVVDRFGRSDSMTALQECVGLVHPQGPLYSLTYGWVAQVANPRPDELGGRKLGFESQTGAAARGFYTDTDRTTSHFTATLSGDRRIHIALDNGTIEWTGDVILNDTFDEHSLYSDRHLLLTARGGSIDGMTLDFWFYDPY